MSKTGMEKTVIFFYFIGTCIWCPILLLLWWRGHEALTFAEASRNSTRLLCVSSTGVLWSIAGAVWLAKLKNTRAT
jgi:hypothetical protein